MDRSGSDPRPYTFLSYASVDRAKALRIADLLEANGISVWIDRKSIAGGTSWSAEIVRGIRGCTVFLVACSPAAMSSPNVQQEIQVAFESRHPIVPLLLEPTEMPESIVYALAGRQWIEVLDEPEENWLAAALRALPGFIMVGRATGAAPPSLDLAPASANPPPAPARHNLPVEVTNFVGRERELQQVRELLAQTHLLTLTGTGGCGKTRLALKLAETVLDSFADGVWLIELAPLADPSLIPQAVARAVSVHEIVGRDLTSVLVDALRPRHLLLIVDNCEHLIADCAQLVESLTRSCPHLRIVATSREILGASGEAVWRIPSLAAPDPQQLPGAAADLADLVAQSDAVRLFVERARHVVPDFQATAANARALAQICYRLDGIALAIELAASRLRTISVDQLAARLDNRFRLLTGGSRTALRRQQTLRALVDWSYDLLSAQEQAFFRKLSVFVGGWHMEAAESVCVNGDGVADVLDQFAALADKSLVLVENNADNAPRYRLLETLREYALERLVSSGETEAVHGAHTTFYVALARRLRAERLAWQINLRASFVEEHDNFRAALRWSAETANWDEYLDLIGSLSSYWVFAGYLNESVQWIDLALQHREKIGPAARSRVLNGLGSLAFGRGDFATAESALRESIEICRDRGDSVEIASAQILLGNVLRDQARYAEARSALEEAVRLGHAIGDQLVVGTGLFQLGLLARQQGDLPLAESLLTQSFQIGRSGTSAEGFGGMIVFNLGLVAEDRGDFQRTGELYAQSVSIFRVSGDRWHLPYVLEGFVTLAARQEKAERALVLAGAAAAARERFGIPIPPVMKERLQQPVASARLDLGEAAEGAWIRGQALTLDDALTYALQDT